MRQCLVEYVVSDSSTVILHYKRLLNKRFVMFQHKLGESLYARGVPSVSKIDVKILSKSEPNLDQLGIKTIRNLNERLMALPVM